MKKLPQIYQIENLNIKTNNKKQCVVEMEKEIFSDNNMDIIDEVFSGLGYSFNIPLKIKTKNNLYTTSLIAKTQEYVITIDNELIPLSEIVYIKRKKN